MINEIKRRLDNGEIVKLICVDEDGFIEKGVRMGGYNFKDTILKGDIFVNSVNGIGGPCPALHIKDQHDRNCYFNILMEDLEYFEIEEFKTNGRC